MDENKNIEEQFRKAFERFEADVPTSVWENVQQHIPTQPKKRLGWLRSFFGVALLGLLAGAFYWFTNATEPIQLADANDTSPISTLVDSKPEVVDAAAKSAQATEASFTPTLTENTAANKNTTIPPNEIASVDSEQNNVQEHKLNDASSLENTQTTTSKITSTKKVLLTENKPTKEFNSLEENLKTNQTSSMFSPLNSGESLDQKDMSPPSFSKMAFLSIPALKEPTMGNSLLLGKEQNPKDYSTRQDFFVGVYGGPSISYRRFSSNHNLMDEHKNANERSGITYDMGIEVGKMINTKWEVSIGLSVDNYAELYDFNGTKKWHDTTVTTHNDPVTGQIISDTSIAEHSEAVGHNTVNRYQFISIPINVGYHIYLSEKWSLSPAVGVSYEFTRNANASWLHPETLDPMIMETETNKDVYRNAVFASSYQVSVYYKATSALTCFVRPRFRMTHQSIFTDSDLLNHKPYSLDLNFGLRYGF